MGTCDSGVHERVHAWMKHCLGLLRRVHAADIFLSLRIQVLSVCSVQYKCVTDAQKRKSLLPGRWVCGLLMAYRALRFPVADGKQ